MIASSWNTKTRLHVLSTRVINMSMSVVLDKQSQFHFLRQILMKKVIRMTRLTMKESTQNTERVTWMPIMELSSLMTADIYNS